MRLMAHRTTMHRPDQSRQPGEFTILQLAEKVIELTGSRSKLVHQAAAAGRSAAAPARHLPGARRCCDWEPKVALDDGLKETIAYFRRSLELS